MKRWVAAWVLAVVLLPVAGCGRGQDALTAAQGATIESVSFHTTTAVIHGDPLLFDITLHNPSPTVTFPFLVQGWLRQGASWRAAGGSYTLCGGHAVEVLPLGFCTFTVGFVADDSDASYGSGTFVPGPATAIIELRRDLVPEDEVVDSVSVPITLVDP